MFDACVPSPGRYLGQGHIRGIAKALDLSPSQVDRTIKRLESGGVLVAKLAGRTKLYEFNPRLSVKAELIALVDKAFSAMSAAEREKFIERRRPRRTGKRL